MNNVKIIGFIVSVLLVGRGIAQPFQIGQLQKTFIDSSRTNRSVPCEIYYPASAAGSNVPIATGSFPVVVFDHGFLMPVSAYDIYWKTLVPQGYIVVLPTTEGSFLPSHLNFGADMAFLCKALKKESTSSNSIFYNSIHSKCAVMGHSMGGGSAFLAAQKDTSITALVTVAAAVTNPSSIIAATYIGQPTLVFAASNDCVAPPSAHQKPMYDSLHSSCKSYIQITGGDHCQFAAYNFNCTLGQSTCSPQATISAAAQQASVFGFLLPWLDFYLKNTCSAAKTFQNLVSSSSGVSVFQNCTLDCSTAVTEKVSDIAFTIFPNPTSEWLTIEMPEQGASQSFTIYNFTGQPILTNILYSGRNMIDVKHLPTGFYVVKFENVASMTFYKHE